MLDINVIGSDALTEAEQSVLDTALTQALEVLVNFSEDEAFKRKMSQIFGDNFDTSQLEALRQKFGANSLEWLPTFEILSAQKLKNAYGAFSTENNRIYLSEVFVAAQDSDPQNLTYVILEEIGHFVDNEINEQDTLGDEGHLFALLSLEVPISKRGEKQLQNEQDSYTLVLDEELLTTVEQATDTSFLGSVRWANANDSLVPANDVEVSLLDASTGQVVENGKTQTDMTGEYDLFIANENRRSPNRNKTQERISRNFRSCSG